MGYTDYRNVTRDGDVLEGEVRRGDGAWTRFSANWRLLKIDEAQERHGLYEEVWDLQDGYGEAGFTPEQGWDWSGIRDSSEGALAAMYDLVSARMTDAELEAILGLKSREEIPDRV